MSDQPPSHVVNVNDVPETHRTYGDHYGAYFKQLTPSMVPRGGRLGVNHMRVPKGRTVCPFHAHLREDEVFFVLSGSGVLRYGEELRTIGQGDCISCPSGTKTAHQIYNPHEEDLVYLAIGAFDPHEVCLYPDSGRVGVRGFDLGGTIEATGYFDDEPNPPRIVQLAQKE
ncbi:MAG: cupin domain-containing protein [Myxococcales bacterium]|nr:cupin domain-containing protein [Myxococcales bacterium]